MLLRDGEPQRLFQQRLGFVAALQLEQKFSQKDAWHHPVAFFAQAKLKMRHGFGRAAFGGQGLGKAEAK